MKIAFVAPRFHTNQYEIVKTLQDRKHAVEFYVNCTAPTEDYSTLVPRIYEPCKLSQCLENLLGEGGGDRPRLFPNPVTYFRDLVSDRPDVMIIRNPARYFSVISACYGRFLGVRIIFYTQTEINQSHSWFKKIQAYVWLKLFDAAWYSPLEGTDQGKSIFKLISYVPFAVPRGDVNKNFSYNQSSDIIQLLMIGKYNSLRKNHLLFIEALAKLQEMHVIHATIVGECMNKSQIERFNVIRQKIDEIGMSASITLETNVPFLEMQKLYASHDVFILPAKSEPASISVLEAIAYGIPAICSVSCGTKSYIKPGKNGYVFKTDDLEDLIFILEKVLGNPNHLCQMKRYCRLNYAPISGEAYYRHLNDLTRSKWNVDLSA